MPYEIRGERGPELVIHTKGSKVHLAERCRTERLWFYIGGMVVGFTIAAAIFA